MSRKLITIVTPCYNEEANVRHHFDRVCAAIEPYRDRYDFEHVYTDNQSQDRTFALLTELASEQPNVRAIRFSRNVGANRAIWFGLRHARGDAAILIQADLQDPPEVIPAFIDGWEEGYDVVYGQIANREESWVMRTLRRIYYWLIAKLSESPVPQNAGEFRLASRRVLDALAQFTEDDLYIRGVMGAIGFPQKPVPYARAERAGGTSSVNFFGLVIYGLNGFVSTTTVPIRLVTILGFALAVVGLGLTAWVVLGELLLDAAPQGFSTLATLITFFAGAQLVALGTIGEYVRKIYVQSLHRPRGFIQDLVGFEGHRPGASAGHDLVEDRAR